MPKKTAPRNLKLHCYWCGLTDTYFVGKFDQPKCNGCGKYVSKKQK